MKINYLSSITILCFCLFSCSNESEYKELVSTEKSAVNFITSLDEMPHEVQSIIAESKTYISPEMQEFINMLDTVTPGRPIEDVFPFLFSEVPFVYEDSTPTLSTKATASTVIFTQASNFEPVGGNVQVTLTSYSSSALRQSLGYYDNITLLGSGPYDVRFIAYTQYVYFTSPIVAIAATPKSSDDIGINPDKMPSSINNNTSLTRGFTIETLAEGYIYSLTTYALEFSIYDGASMLVFPRLAGRETNFLDVWRGYLVWTCLVIS